MKKLSVVCIGVGAFLVVVGLLFQTYGASQLKKTPLDVDTTTRLEGSATSYTGGGMLPFPVKVASITKADADKSDDDVVVFKSSTCVVKDIGDPDDCVAADDPDKRLVSASVEDFATDRKTGLSVNGEDYVPADAPEREGLMNKWPFGAEKKTYPFWTAGGVADAVYDRTEEIDGLETYVYKVEISDAPTEIAPDVQGLYTESTEVYIEPATGQIVKQVREQNRAFEDGAPALDLAIEFTDAQVAANVEKIGDDKDKLQLVTGTVPLVGYIAGGLLLLVGLALLLMGRSSSSNGPTSSRRGTRTMANA